MTAFIMCLIYWTQSLRYGNSVIVITWLPRWYKIKRCIKQGRSKIRRYFSRTFSWSVLKKKNLENIRWAETYGVMHIPSRSFQYCSFFQKPPLENMDYIKLSQQERTSLQQLLQDLFLSLAPPFSSLFLFFFFFFPCLTFTTSSWLGLQP